MKRLVLLAAQTALLFALTPAVAQAETWLFAAAACPAWKAVPDDPELTAKMAGACQKDVDLIVDGFRTSFGVTEDHITTLVNAQATGTRVKAALAELAAHAKPEDTVIIYVNTHGGKVEAMYKGYEVKDEIFAWYTVERPADVAAATADDTWMTAHAFRDSVNQIMAEKIVTVIEACHADASLNDYINNVHNGIGGRGEDWPGREAVIFSAHEEQIANFTSDGTEALFTQVWSDALKQDRHASLFDSFEQARLETHHQARAACEQGHTHAELVEGWSNYRLMCTQMPTAWDPFGLLEDIRAEHVDYGMN
ncbi:MAG: hypothetical protein V3U96_12635 [Paracoccaceae bacterium]